MSWPAIQSLQAVLNLAVAVVVGLVAVGTWRNGKWKEQREVLEMKDDRIEELLAKVAAQDTEIAALRKQVELGQDELRVRQDAWEAQLAGMQLIIAGLEKKLQRAEAASRPRKKG